MNKTKRIKPVFIIILSSILLSTLIILIMRIENLFINYTSSMPIGLYKKINEKPKKNDLVLFIPSYVNTVDKKFYDDLIRNKVLLLKKIVAVENDIVTIDKNGVYVNDLILINSKPIKNVFVNPFFISDYKLKNSEFLVMSEYSFKSFDSRYFGIININNIVSVAKPILVTN